MLGMYLFISALLELVLSFLLDVLGNECMVEVEVERGRGRGR